MKRIVSIVLSLCFVLSMAVVMPMDGLFIEADAALSVSGGTLNSATFIIDPGHGGSDPGACNGSRHEADDVLRLSLRVAQLINANGSSCALTRVTDVTQSLATKYGIANAGSFTYFVSIHRNSGGGVGIESYYYSGLSASSTGAKLCTTIHNSMVNAGVWTKNRGVKTGNFAVIRETNMAATLLEVGFIDSATDNSIFDNHFETIAVSIANGMLAMIGKSVSNTGGTTTKYQSCLDNPGGGSKTNGAISASASVTQSGGTDALTIRGWTLHTDGISAVKYKVDSGSYKALSTSLRTDVQAAISGYSNYDNCGFDGTVSYKNLSGGTHTVTIQATTKKSNTYTVATITLTVSDPIKPTLSNVQITNVTTSGYRVSCTVSDNAGIDRVEFPTWTAGGGQDDLVWHRGTVSGNTAYYDVKISEHGNSQDVYATHIYAYDISGNQTSASSAGANLSSDSTAPKLSGCTIQNVNYWGFDVVCNVSDNIGVTKVQFPTWTAAGGQDDIKWYDVSVSGGKATLHVNTADHGYAGGTYNVHLYAWDLWNNEGKVEMTVNIPVPQYPTDADYIPVTAFNAGQSSTNAQVMTSGTINASDWGVLVLEASGTKYVVKSKLQAGAAKSVTATSANPIVAIPQSAAAAFAAFTNTQIGAEVSIEGINLSTGKVLAQAHVKVPYTFVLVDDSKYDLDEKYVTVKATGAKTADIAAEFKCTVKLFSASGVQLSDNAIGGTGCVVKYLSDTGALIASATVVIPGDLTGDGVINTTDLACAHKLIGLGYDYSNVFNIAGDVTGDKVLNTADYLTVRKHCDGSNNIYG
ncbi:MAG: GBS Bsp-like repeat-containing protein [Clostridia bacterium]|nr:GBS Bsp-like repeat-containing protein [Clostridia bacterium]